MHNISTFVSFYFLEKEESEKFGKSRSAKLIDLAKQFLCQQRMYGQCAATVLSFSWVKSNV